MRAERLIALLMLLQSRGRMSAAGLARCLEVSERTIYRDIEALGAAGVPVYSQLGPAGGYALLDNYRTSLTGLTEGEARALSMLSTPAPLAVLGLGEQLGSALLKLSAALPDALRSQTQHARQRFHLDANWWQQGEQAIPHLQTLYQAVWQDRCVYLRYQPALPVEIEQVVQPYGLVAKAGVWYLVCAFGGRAHVHPAASLREVRLTEERFSRPHGFDLADFWQAWCEGEERRQSLFRVQVRLPQLLIDWLSGYFAEGFRERAAAAQPDSSGYIRLELAFESFEAARDRLLSLGGAIEVLEPFALRKSLADYARQILERYERQPSAGTPR